MKSHVIQEIDNGIEGGLDVVPTRGLKRRHRMRQGEPEIGVRDSPIPPVSSETCRIPCAREVRLGGSADLELHQIRQPGESQVRFRLLLSLA